MKKLIAGLALSVVMINPVMAADEATCRMVKDLAESNMKVRQAGIDIIKVLELTDGKSGKLIELDRKLVIDAYKEIAYSTPEYQEKAVREFGTKHYLNCIK